MLLKISLLAVLSFAISPIFADAQKPLFTITISPTTVPPLAAPSTTSNMTTMQIKIDPDYAPLKNLKGATAIINFFDGGQIQGRQEHKILPGNKIVFDQKFGPGMVIEVVSIRKDGKVHFCSGNASMATTMIKLQCQSKPF